VAGGPADPGAWDRWFGDPGALPEGEAEAQARDRKAASLPAEIAELYLEVKTLREGGRIDVTQLQSLRAKIQAHPREWLLQTEVAELEAGA
jgi:phenylalanine-4-hydroxylase